MSADHAVQTAIRLRLVATSAVTDLVPATSILDVNQRPAPVPSIILGEGQSIQSVGIARTTQVVYATLHIWKKEPGLVGVKDIAGAIRKAIHSSRLTLATPYHCGDCYVSDMRFLRDPDGETAHGVITVEALVSEVA